MIQLNNGLRLVLASTSRRRLPSGSTRAFPALSVGIGEDPPGTYIIGVTFELKDGNQYGYYYDNYGSFAAVEQAYAQLTGELQGARGGVYFNPSVRPNCIAKFVL